MREPALFETLRPLLAVAEHDPRDLPLEAKASMTVGMGMTEKQGGTDVRTNTHARPPAGEGGGAEYALTRPQVVLLGADVRRPPGAGADRRAGPTCFFVPRWRPDGARTRCTSSA